MRNYSEELEKRISFIKKVMSDSGASGIIYGNSGGKDCTLVGILCRKACENTLGITMPCASKRNYNEDMDDAMDAAKKFGIETRMVDLTELKALAVKTFGVATELTPAALSNIAPRLRMLTLYTIAASENRLVAGTGNRSEAYMGYFTKWGDGAYDFNPIADLTVTEVYEFLRFLGAPDNIITKAPSAGLFEGQTDENEMGISYAKIDEYLLSGKAEPADLEIIERFHKRSGHKREMPKCYK